MPHRPEFLHPRATSVDFPASGSEDIFDEVELSTRIHYTLNQSDATSHLLSSRIHGTIVPDNEDKATRDSSRARTHDIILLASIFVMLVWPWIFLIVTWKRKGVQANNDVAKVVIDNPHFTSYIATFLGHIVNLIIGTLFSFTIVRYAQGKITSNKDVTVFQVILLSGFRHQNWPWGLKDLNREFIRTGWLPSIGIWACIAAFASVSSGATSLITPVPFYRAAMLTGTELDFSSTAADCLAWFSANPIPTCDKQMSKDMNTPVCLRENQIVDIVEAGRASILDVIPNNTQSLTLSQLGAPNGIHVFGPIRGVLPIDPNSVLAFNTLQTSPLNRNSTVISYNYTLYQQGLASNVSCIYDTQSPITYEAIPNNSLILSSSGNCVDGLVDFLPQLGVQNFATLNTNNTLMFWSCKSVPTGGEQPTYYVYLRGRTNYESVIGNITCTVTQIQPAIFPVVYQSGPGIFSTKNPTATSAPAFPGFTEDALVALGGVVMELQNIDVNLLAEMAITVGSTAIKMLPENIETYPRVYQAMLQGILEYQNSYARSIYSGVSNRPQSCNRAVNGSVSYKVIGWKPTRENGYFLIPMSALNLASLIVLLRTMFKAKRDCYPFDPLNPSSLLLASAKGEKGPVEWEAIVKYRRKARKERGPKFVDDPLAEYLVEEFSG